MQPKLPPPTTHAEAGADSCSLVGSSLGSSFHLPVLWKILSGLATVKHGMAS